LSVRVESSRRFPVSAGAAAPEEFYDAYTFNVESRSVWARARRRFLRHRLAVASLLVLVALFSVGLLAGQLAPYGYGEINPNALNQAPSWAHPFGTDQTGRDYFSRVLDGIGTEARVAMLVAFFGTLVGTTIGVCAGYFGGLLGEALMRFTDLILTLPALVTVLVAAAYLHTTTTFKVALLLSCLLWMPMARILRGSCLSLREREYVEAALAMGASDLRIIVRHILPNAIGPLTVAATAMTANAIVLETTLAYLGFAIPVYSPNAPKPQASLGNIMSDANVEGLFHWWGLFFPGLILMVMIVSIYYVGDGLRDALDPSDGRRATPRGRRRELKGPLS
jgi:ABC-type dipeptide/oligopeptide/nickel transport system permease subunit